MLTLCCPHLRPFYKLLRRVSFSSKLTDAGSASVDNDPSLGIMTRSAWTLVQEQLTDVVQAAFGLLSELAASRLDRIAIPQLLKNMELSVAHEFTKSESAYQIPVQIDDQTQNAPDVDWFSDDKTWEVNRSLHVE